MHMNQTAEQKMTEADIIDYLKSNPKFLQKNPDAVDYLLPPKDTANGRRVVDFQHYMVEKLKTHKKMVLDTTRDIIDMPVHDGWQRCTIAIQHQRRGRYLW